MLLCCISIHYRTKSTFKSDEEKHKHTLSVALTTWIGLAATTPTARQGSTIANKQLISYHVLLSESTGQTKRTLSNWEANIPLWIIWTSLFRPAAATHTHSNTPTHTRISLVSIHGNLNQQKKHPRTLIGGLTDTHIHGGEQQWPSCWARQRQRQQSSERVPQKFRWRRRTAWSSAARELRTEYREADWPWTRHTELAHMSEPYGSYVWTLWLAGRRRGGTTTRQRGYVPSGS